MSTPTEQRRVAESARRFRLWPAALGVLVGTAALLSRTVDDFGITWDEPVYRYTQVQMAEWLAGLARCRSVGDVQEMLGARSLHDHWIGGRYGKNFHPPMAAVLNNAAYAVFGRWRGDMPARRMASALELAGAAALLLIFVGRRYGPASGAVAAASLCLMPRVFGHANLAATDMPMLFFWGAVALVFWRAVEGGEGARGRGEASEGRGAERSRGCWVAFGVLLGMGFLVKLPTVLVLLPIVVWLPLVRSEGEKGRGARRRDVGWLVAMAIPLLVVGVEVHRQAGAMWDVALEQIPRETVRGERWLYLAETYLLHPQASSPVPAWLIFVPLALWWNRYIVGRWRRGAASSPVTECALAALAWAPAVAVALHPGWWHNTLVRLGHYYLLCTQRSGALPEIEIFYLGRKYVYSLPWHNGFVLLGVTVPLGILALGACGAVSACLRVRRDRLPLFLLLNLLTLPVVRMFGTPAHDGVRLMLPAFFFLAALAGIGFGAVCEGLANRLRGRGRTVPPRGVLRGAVAAVGLLPALLGLVRSHPYELSYYNPAVAGLPGASRLGFEVSYWYDALNPAAVQRWHTQLPDDAVPVLPAAAPDQPSSAAAAVWMSLTGKADPKEQPGSDGTRFLLLLTHSSKSQPTDRLIFAMRPTLVLTEHRAVRLLSVYDERAMARAQALALLSEAAGSVKRSTGLRGQLEEIRRAQPQAVAEAEEILERRAGDVARVVRYEGYLPDAVRGAYLDDE